MSIGIDYPVKVNVSGGVKKIKESRQLLKLLILALSEGDDENPFQNLGIRSIVIFKINDAATLSEAKLEVEKILSKFKDRISIDKRNPIEFFKRNETEIGLKFGYVDLETNKKEEFNEIFSQAGRRIT